MISAHKITTHQLYNKTHTNFIMVSNLSFDKYSAVMSSWERIKRVKDYDKDLGILVFSKFFSMHPETANIFGISDPAEVSKNKTFVGSAKKFVNFCDSFLDMLGPDTDMLSDILEEEGRKHARMGIQLHHYGSMGNALIEGIKTFDRKFNDDTELCWREVYSGVSHDLRRAVIYEKAGRRRTI